LAFYFWVCAREKVDYAVLETGLGGLHDASNIVQNADKICVLTDIGFDHEKILGETLPEIATQKAGIIAPENNVFYHPQLREILDVFESATRKNHATIHEVPDNSNDFLSRNFSLARAVSEFVITRDNLPKLSEKDLEEARKIHIPARVEEFDFHGKKVIIDGAHNPQKLMALSNYLNWHFAESPSRKRILIFSLGENKMETSIESMQIAREISDKIILTTFRDETIESAFRENIDLEILYESARRMEFSEIKIIKNPRVALTSAMQAGAEIVVVAGSFYLLNSIRPLLTEVL
jgi:dihydrofolate synthase/folylpolyglutamate synthase